MNRLDVFDDTNLEYSEMTTNQLFRIWYEELEFNKSSFSDNRLQWFKSLSNGYYATKIATMSGYLMATRDSGKNVGDLIAIIQELLRRTNTE